MYYGNWKKYIKRLNLKWNITRTIIIKGKSNEKLQEKQILGNINIANLSEMHFVQPYYNFLPISKQE